MNKPFCIAPWTHFHVRQDGHVFPCCMFPGTAESMGNINDESWSEIWSGEKFQKLREGFLANDPKYTENCKHCVYYEKVDGYSNRQQFEDIVARSNQSKDRIISKPRILSLDIRPSKTCNLACIICNSWSSSRIAAELGDSKEKTGYLTEIGLQELESLLVCNRSKILHVLVVGGEPTLMKETYDILEKLQQYKYRISLFFNINGTKLQLGSQNFLDLLEGFQYVHLDVSLDAVGAAAEYQRYGCVWSEVDHNFRTILRTFKGKDGVKVSVHPTVSVLNILRLPELFNYLDQVQKEEQVEFDFSGGNILDTPKELDIRLLPKDLKTLIIKKLKECKVPDQYQKVLGSWVKILGEAQEEQPFGLCRNYIKSYDCRRKNSFLSINPEFEEWWKKLD